MRGPQPTQIELTDCQQTALQQIVGKATGQQIHVLRAKIILPANLGNNNQQIANQLQIHRETARSWPERWAEKADALAAAEAQSDEKQLRKLIVEILSDHPRCGSPGTFTAEQICQMIAVACEKPETYGRPVTHWTAAELASEAVKQGIVESISPRSVGRFFKRSRPQTASVALLAE